MLKPFVAVLAWAAVLVIIFYPIHKRLVRVITTPSLCAALSSLLVIIVILVPFALVAVAVINELRGTADYVQTNLPVLLNPNASVIGRAITWVENQAGVTHAQSQQILGNTLRAAGGTLATQTLGIVGGAIGLIVQAFFVIITMYYLFRDSEQILGAIRNSLPLEDQQSEDIFRRTREVIEASVHGVITVAMVQGALGGLAFWVFGLPSALLWGVFMALVAILPMAGAWLVWIPAAVYLLATGHWVKAIALVVWGALVVGTIDNFLQPRLVGKRAHMHELLVFFSVLGGLTLFGVLGIILGPVVLAIAMALLDATGVADRSLMKRNPD
jgi:predicted PurR-regulated permease PerM